MRCASASGTAWRVAAGSAEACGCAEREMGEHERSLCLLPARRGDGGVPAHQPAGAGVGSVQLFVQRGFMGLEPDVTVQADGAQGDSAWRWWKWMRKYRVWEANRKVFLWPENWIEPELKKDRSPFFRDLEKSSIRTKSTSSPSRPRSRTTSKSWMESRNSRSPAFYRRTTAPTRSFMSSAAPPVPNRMSTTTAATTIGSGHHGRRWTWISRATISSRRS